MTKKEKLEVEVDLLENLKKQIGEEIRGKYPKYFKCRENCCIWDLCCIKIIQYILDIMLSKTKDINALN